LKSKWTIFITILLAVVLVVTMTVTGCKTTAVETAAATTAAETAAATTAAATTAAATAPAEPVKLLVWSEPFETSFADMGTFTWKESIEKYKADTGSTTEIKVVEYPFGGLSEAVLVSLQSDTFPDLYYGSINRITPLVALGVMAEIPEGTQSKDVWMDKAFELGSYQGKQYMTFQHTAVFPLLVNRALFEKAGIMDLLPDEETRSWSRADFEAAIKAIDALGPDTYGISFDLVWNDTDKGNDGFVWADGDGWTDDTYRTATFNTPKSIANFEWIMGIMKGEGVYPNPLSVDVFPQLEDFYKGKIGITCTYLANEVVEVNKRIADGTITKEDSDPYYVLFPTDDGSPSKLMTIGNAWAMKKQDDAAKNAAAQDFLKWLNDPEKSMHLQALMSFPQPSLLLKGFADSLDTTGQEEIFALAFMAALPGVEPTILPAAIPGFQRLRTVWHENIQLAYLGDLTPKEAREKMQIEAQAIIDEEAAKLPN